MKYLQRRDTGSGGAWVTIAYGSPDDVEHFTDYEASADGSAEYRTVGRLRAWLRSR